MKITQVIDCFRLLANEVLTASRQEPRFVQGPINGPLLIRGGLVLEGQVADRYFGTLELLSPKESEESVWSRESIDSVMAQTLLELLADETEGALKKAVQAFRKRIESQSSDFTFRIGVFGLDSDSGGLSFGKLIFETGTYATQFPVPNLFANTVGGRAILVAVVTVRAVDKDSAKKRAERVVDRHLSVLNALMSDGFPSTIQFSRSFLGSHSIQLCSSPDDRELLGTVSVESRLISRIDIENTLQRSGEIASALLKADDDYASRILAAYEIAGAACADARAHQAFLLFAIALESAVLGEKTESEITYQLAARVAHLLSDQVEQRRQIARKVRALYKRRSVIVHAGRTTLAASEVRLIQHICLSTLSSLAKLRLNSSADLDSWFEDRMLGVERNRQSELSEPKLGKAAQADRKSGE